MHDIRISAPVLAVLACSLALQARQAGWRADPKVVEQLTKQQPAVNYDESKVPRYTLPDVLAAKAGRVTSQAAWKLRRAEILDLFRTHVYGRSAAMPQEFRFKVTEENPAAMDGAATLKRVAVMSANHGRELVFELTMFLPNARRERARAVPAAEQSAAEQHRSDPEGEVRLLARRADDREGLRHCRDPGRGPGARRQVPLSRQRDLAVRGYR